MAKSVLMLDRAQAPTLRQAQAALAEIGGNAWAYYLGGAGHFGDRPSYTPRLLKQFHDAKIRTLPIYVGAQKALSRARGLSDAKDACARAQKFGDGNAPVMCDIERGPFNRSPANALAYARGWCAGVHAAGMRAGVYGPFLLMESLTHPAPAAEMPDVLWPARWIEDGGVLPPKAEWPTDARGVKGVPKDKLAAPGHRGWQFVGDVVLPQSRINVDISVIDLDCFPGGAIPSPRAASAPAKPAPAPAPKPVAGAKPRTVTIKSGDTLFALERRLGLPSGSLFRRNTAVIEAAARRHGHPSSKNGGLIFPGTTLTLP